MGLRQTIDGVEVKGDANGVRPEPIEALRRRLASLAEEVYDDEVPPAEAAKEALFAAIGDLTSVDGEGALPAVSTLGGGDLQCYWSRDGRTASLAISADGRRRLQEVMTDGAGTRTLAVVDAPESNRLVASIRWVFEHAE